VDISFAVCLCVCVFGCVCKVTDFSGEDKASGIKLCMLVHRRHGQGIPHYGERFSSFKGSNPKKTNFGAANKQGGMSYCNRSATTVNL